MVYTYTSILKGQGVSPLHLILEKKNNLMKFVQMKLAGKEKKLLEQRIKELNDMVQNRTQDSMNQSKIVNDKDLYIVRYQ